MEGKMKEGAEEGGGAGLWEGGASLAQSNP